MSLFHRASWPRRARRCRLTAAVVAVLSVPAAFVATPAFAQSHGAPSDALSGEMTGVPASGVPASGAPAPDARPRLVPDPAFARYPQYRGTLGARPIVLRMGVKPDDPDGLNGEIALLADGTAPAQVLLIAGARDGDTLTLEESDDGVRISGQWVGVIAADGGMSGERMNNDGSISTPFDLRPAPRPPGSGAGRGTASQSGPGRARPADSQGWP